MTATHRYALKTKGLYKSFGNVRANDDISLAVRAGTIHGIVGENGAGKSTLMNMLYGFYQPDAGDIEIHGDAVTLSNPHIALDHGVGMVHQHFKLVETFTVQENIMLGFEGGAILSNSKAGVRAQLLEIEAAYGLEVSPDALVEDLPVGIQQRVEILKALYRGADILILDEPTAVLTPQESAQLFAIMRKLQREGKSIIFITHKLHEVMAITDAVSVMRNGKIVDDFNTSDTNEAKLAELMVGEVVAREVSREKAADTGCMLSIRNVTVARGQSKALLNNVSLDIVAGQVMGIAGVAGNGQSELIKAVTGMIRIDGGEITFGGTLISSAAGHESPVVLRAMGMGHVAEDRLADGIVGAMNVRENIILGYQSNEKYQNKGMLRRSKITDDCDRIMQEHDVRPRTASLALASFSGGNQQKLVVGREVDHDPRLLVIGQPTRGVDIGAVTRIHDQITSLRNAGKAVLVVSADLDELVAICDKIAVMCEGDITGVISVEDADERTLGLMMAGQKQANEKVA